MSAAAPARSFALALSALVLAPCAAHDLWIEPDPFLTAPGSPVALTLRLGEEFIGQPQVCDPAVIVDFAVIGPDGRVPVNCVPGADPAGRFTPSVPGIHLVGYRSTRSFVDLDPAAFLAYLEEEGLEHIAHLRQQRGESGQNGREFYSRSAKSLVSAGPGSASEEWRQPLGYTVELVPLADPFALPAGAPMPVRFLYLGKPQPDVLVVAYAGRETGEPQRVRTDAAGEVQLRMDQAGPWMIKAVHAVPLPPEETGAEWESFWATLTFSR